MAEAYFNVRGGPMSGQPIEKVISYHRDVGKGLRGHANYRAAKAKAVLNASAERTGDSQIVVEKLADNTYTVSLTDERGQFAANVIEYGRGPQSSNGPSRAVAPLQRAFGFGWHT